MEEIILVRVSGDDRPGLTASLTQVMARYNVAILDIGQAVIHDSLSLGILIRIPPESETAPILKDLLFAAHKLDVHLSFTPITAERYRRWVDAQGKPRQIVTLLAERITAPQIAAITKAIADNGMNIDVIHRLSGRMPLSPQGNPRPACVEFSVRGTPTEEDTVRRSFLSISAELGVDIAYQEDNLFRRNRRLVAFDMDSTLIRAEMIDELAAAHGVGDQVSAITEQAMRGEIDFKESLRRRLSLLQGMDAAALERIAEEMPLTDGAERCIATLKGVGFKIAIISGGFTFFGNKLKQRLGIDYVFANELEIQDGRLTGKVVGDIVDAEKKADILRAIARQEEINLQQVIAVGDGANDLPMLNLAGLGIAFHAKPLVKAGASQAISTFGLDSILYLIGVREREFGG